VDAGRLPPPLLLATLVLLPTVVASGFMVNVLPRAGGTILEVAIVVVFGVLFGWISIRLLGGAHGLLLPGPR